MSDDPVACDACGAPDAGDCHCRVHRVLSREEILAALKQGEKGARELQETLDRMHFRPHSNIRLR